MALALSVVALRGVLPAHANKSGASSTTTSAYTTPTWYAKYQALSSGKGITGGGGTQSVSVGANVDASNESGPQSETSIAINAANPAQIVAGSNEIFRDPMRAYYSTDGGASYTGVDLPLPPPLTNNGMDFGSDPTIAWDTHGNVYYGYIIVFFGNGSGINGTEMAVARSSDGGKTWTTTYFNPQTGSAQFNDKPMLTVDDNINSPYRDTVYIAWDNNNGNASSSNYLLVSHSSDGGKTFSAPVPANDTSSGPKSVIGADPFIGPNGTVYVAWHDTLNSLIAESSSTDGGQTFGPTHTVAPTNAAFDIGIPSMASRRALVYPACGADTSAGAYRGSLYCSWTDQTAANGTDIFVSRSVDGGQTWSAQARVNDDPAGVASDQFNQWLAVDPVTGSVDLSWNDTRNDPSHLSTDIYFTQSVNGGASYTANTKVTTAMTNESCCGADLGNQYGDYEGIAAYNGVIHPVWTDRRASVVSLDEEVFSATLKAK
ncbi:MAG TPA: sialidase family protein [Ktedonobacterales bacterium]